MDRREVYRGLNEKLTKNKQENLIFIGGRAHITARTVEVISYERAIPANPASYFIKEKLYLCGGENEGIETVASLISVAYSGETV